MALCALLEEAIAADPNNGELWRMLVSVYSLQVTKTSQADGNLTALVPVFRRAAGAFERALKIDPNDADALGGHGMALTILSSLGQKPELFSKGVAEMNRAVELSPSTAGVRLLPIPRHCSGGARPGGDQFGVEVRFSVNRRCKV